MRVRSIARYTAFLCAIKQRGGISLAHVEELFAKTEIALRVNLRAIRITECCIIRRCFRDYGSY